MAEFVPDPDEIVWLEFFPTRAMKSGLSSLGRTFPRSLQSHWTDGVLPAHIKAQKISMRSSDRWPAPKCGSCWSNQVFALLHPAGQGQRRISDSELPEIRGKV